MTSQQLERRKVGDLEHDAIMAIAKDAIEHSEKVLREARGR
jgi:hypothetical protein